VTRGNVPWSGTALAQKNKSTDSELIRRDSFERDIRESEEGEEVNPINYKKKKRRKIHQKQEKTLQREARDGLSFQACRVCHFMERVSSPCQENEITQTAGISDRSHDQKKAAGGKKENPSQKGKETERGWQ